MSSILTHFTITVSATSAVTQLPSGTISVLCRARSTNAGTTYFMLDSSPANSTAGTPVKASETVNIDISQNIAVVASQNNGFISPEKFIRNIAVIGTANDVLDVDVVVWA